MTTESSKTCGEVLVELLQSYGIEIVFGIPGVHTVELYRGLPNTGLRHITPRHEQGAGFMADGYARVTGKPAACFIISGPGMTNIITAMAQAYSDSVPMLVISSVNNSHELALGGGRLHELPSQRQLVAGVSVFSHTVARPSELAEVLARAFAVFDSARPGPVHIELPLDVITAPMAAGRICRRSASATGRGRVRRGHRRRQCAYCYRLHQNPFIVLGGGTQDAADAARDNWWTGSAMRTALTVNAKGVLAADHPLKPGQPPAATPGARCAGEPPTWCSPSVPSSAKPIRCCSTIKLELSGQVIRVDIEPEQMTRNVLPVDLDLRRCRADDAGDCTRPWPASVPLRAAGRGRRTASRRLTPWRPRPTGNTARFLDLVAATLPGVVVAGDSTQPVYGANLFYEADQPRRYFNSSTGYGTLGYGLPAALGAKLGLPHTSVVSLIGDGGLQFTIAELATAVELQLSVPVLVWNNNGYGEIKRYMLERDIPTIGVDIYTPDFITIAKGFGCAAETVSTRDEFVDALRRADKAGKPTLIDIPEHLALNW